MGNIASVVISNCTREFDKEYHYIIPDCMVGKVVPGIRVMVPFGKSNKNVEAYVIRLVENTETIRLKEIVKVIDENVVLIPQMIKLAEWMKYKYICTYSDAIKCMLPSGIGVKSLRIVKLVGKNEDYTVNAKKIVDILNDCGSECEYGELQKLSGVKGFSKYIKMLEDTGVVKVAYEYSTRVREKRIRVAHIAVSREEIIDEIESNRIKRIQQIRILEMLLDTEYISVPDIIRFSGSSASVLDTLKKYGYIDFKDIEINRDPVKHRVFERTEPLKPTLQQDTAIKKVIKKLDAGVFGEVLIHGVTGSGKTEVYLQLIQHVLEKGKHAIILVPEISLTPQMVERFKGRFGDDVAVLHSRLSPGERYDQWRLIKDGSIKVAVGARSAVFAPFSKLGIIVVDEEHESSYKSETTPKYSALEVARHRCANENALLLLGSATPSVETYYRAQKGKIDLLELNDRTNNMVMPHVCMVDMRSELSEGNRTIFSSKLREEIEINVKSGQQTILFINRRGHASFVMCRNCGCALKCPNCNITITYHSYDERLICHYCGFTVKSPKLCPKCKSSHIRQFGTGTQRVEEDVKKNFPGATVIRMDMDTTTCKNSHEYIINTFREQNINIMVGTQMIAKGHDFPNVTLVGVLAADSLLNIGDYRASEKTFQLITQVAGRAGRAELPGRVVIQTYNTDDFSILAACNHDYSAFYKQEITVREKLDYPPFTNIANVVLSCADDKLAFNTAKTVGELIRAYFPVNGERVDVLGPTRSPLTKIKNKYRWRIVIKCKNMEKLISVLSKVSDEFYKKKKGKNEVELGMDINPVNML